MREPAPWQVHLLTKGSVCVRWLALVEAQSAAGGDSCNPAAGLAPAGLTPTTKLSHLNEMLSWPTIQKLGNS